MKKYAKIGLIVGAVGAVGVVLRSAVRKVVSDSISRVRRISREIENVDSEYNNDKCAYLLSLFENLGDNPEMKRYNSGLPVGSKSISGYKYALMNYIKFRQYMEGRKND